MVPKPNAAPRHTEAQPGWIIFVGTKGHYWHRLQADWTTLCRPNSTRLPAHVQRWSAEPTGRWDVCPDCRERYEAIERDLRKLKAVEAVTKPLPPAPEQEPEVLGAPDETVETVIEPEPVVATVPDVPVPSIQSSEERTPMQSTRPAPTSAPSNGMPVMMAASAFAEQHTLQPHEVLTFINEKMPGTPRLGSSKKAPYLLDEKARQRILAELPAWLEARRNRRPLSQHEQVMQELTELRASVELLTEEIVKLAKGRA